LHADARLLGIAHSIERAFASDAACARPLPSMQALRTPRPELRSIVTDPPLFPPLASPGGPQDATPTAV
jgi:amidase